MNDNEIRIEHQGYDDKLEKHIYTVHWTEEKDGVRYLNSKTFLTESQPTNAILYIWRSLI